MKEINGKKFPLRNGKHMTDLQRARRYKKYLELKEEFEPKKKKKDNCL